MHTRTSAPLFRRDVRKESRAKPCGDLRFKQTQRTDYAPTEANISRHVSSMCLRLPESRTCVVAEVGPTHRVNKRSELESILQWYRHYHETLCREQKKKRESMLSITLQFRCDFRRIANSPKCRGIATGSSPKASLANLVSILSACRVTIESWQIRK